MEKNKAENNMRRIIIDGAYVESMEKLHDMLKFSLDLPAWYGRNLDALYDCLTGELKGKTVIVVRHEEMLAELGGGRGEALLSVLRDADEESRRLKVIFE